MHESVNILNVNISRLKLDEAIHLVKRAILSKRKLFITVPNVFVVTECRRDKEYRKIINSANLMFPDGMPLVWASYLLGKYTGGRTAGPDFFSEFIRVCEENGFKCYFLGGGPGGSESVVNRLSNLYPRLKIVGNYSPPFGNISPRLNHRILLDIDHAKPDILWVGLGSPRQEKWIYYNLDKLKVNMAIGVGAAFYYISGKKNRAPVWMQKFGLEWSYRILFENPNLIIRKRYYSYFWEFILPILYQVLKERVFKRKSLL